jgi:CO/xanthine dehydrogenase Mo-binding subunit
MTTSAHQQLPASLQNNPNLDDWIRIEADDTVTIFTGKVEIGQALHTALAQIGAEELDVDIGRVRIAMADTGRSPDEGTTAGSNSIQASGSAVRQAAADARYILLSTASERWNIPIAQLRVDDGTILDMTGHHVTTYWELMGGHRFNCAVTGVGTPKPHSLYSIVGQSVPRFDLPAKVTGRPVFVHDMELPGMVHGRVVRPFVHGAHLTALPEDAAHDLPGVLAVVRNGDFLGVVAEREEQALRAAAALRRAARWRTDVQLPAPNAVYQHLRTAPAQSFLVVDGTPVDGPLPPIQVPVNASQTLTSTYYRPFHMHASLGPSAAIAQFEDNHLTVWTHSQGVYALRSSLAQVLDMADEDIRVIHVEGSGCYGHNGADDVALDAALLAHALPGRPVLLQWTRADENAWEPYGSAMVMQMQASLDDAGRVVNWNHDVYSYTHSGRPRPMSDRSNLLAAWHLEAPTPPLDPQPGTGYHDGIHRNADPLYNFAQRRVVKHFVPNSPLRTSSLRSLGAYGNVFAIESFMDELAHAAGVDPVEFRLRHLEDERAHAVIEAATSAAGWHPRERPAGNGRGRGIGFARYKNEKSYAAVIVDLTVDRDSGRIALEHVTIAADAGQIINPDGLRNQLEGGMMQAASWTLKEAVRFDQNGVTSLDWERYPILTFAEAPTVETVLIDRPGLPSLGAGEATQGPTPAAIANAIFDATRARLRQIPFTPERVRAALAQERPVAG